MQAGFDQLVIFILLLLLKREWWDLEFGEQRESRQMEGCHGNCLLDQRVVGKTVCKLCGRWG